MAAKTNNFNNDLAMPWWNGVTRQRIFRDIAAETEKGNTGLATKKNLKEEADQLVSILTSLDSTVENSFGSLEHEMQITYASAFGLIPDPEGTGGFIDGSGNFYETLYAKIRADAQSISEQFSQDYDVLLEQYNGLTNTVTELKSVTEGEIRRGFIEVGGVTYFGIAITSRDIFTQTTREITDNNETHTYYEISNDTGVRFGLYTASGWQFWADGRRVGWYDTSDGRLHIGELSVDGSMQMGDWKFVNNGNSFGIKYLG